MSIRAGGSCGEKRKWANLIVVQSLALIKKLEPGASVGQVCAEYSEYGVVRKHEGGNKQRIGRSCVLVLCSATFMLH